LSHINIREHRSVQPTGDFTGTGRAKTETHIEIELTAVSPEQLKLLKTAAGVLLNYLRTRDLIDPSVPASYADSQPATRDVAQLLEELQITPEVINHEIQPDFQI
jgi:hypothetical protein